ncbi:MAG: MarR family transcriptional regulator [Roseburia sp.]|nr:MarR family transcriptional regulator [Roseburia sp.]
MRRVGALGYKIRLIHNGIHKRMEAKRSANGDNLTGMQRWLIGYLNDHEDEDIYQKDIEAAFSVSRATASNMLSVMERNGLLERVSVEKDARLKKLMLTDKAKNMLHAADLHVAETENLLMQGFTKAEVAQLMGYLDRILQNLGTEDFDSLAEERPND